MLLFDIILILNSWSLPIYNTIWSNLFTPVIFLINFKDFQPCGIVNPKVDTGINCRRYQTFKSLHNLVQPVFMKLFILHHLYVLAFGQTLDIARFDNFYLQGSTNINLTDFSLLINSDVCNVAKVGRVRRLFQCTIQWAFSIWAPDNPHVHQKGSFNPFSQVDLVTIVSTATQHVGEREIIRGSWGKPHMPGVVTRWQPNHQTGSVAG